MEYLSEAIRIFTALASLGAVVMSFINSRKIREVHVSINSRMDQLLLLRGEASRAEGAAQERADARASGNGDTYITDKLKK